jgi:NTP pyrophosphatase (non-canonical NTP hydrolase)
MKKQDLDHLATCLREFANERDWEQFHSPKNLAMALTVETAELLEHFQWMTEVESAKPTPEKLQQIQEEIGDVLIYLTRFADKLGIDPLDAAYKKLEINRQKYPVEKARGSAKKYSEF